MDERATDVDVRLAQFGCSENNASDGTPHDNKIAIDKREKIWL
jgi:hypothetical protein